MKIKCDLTKNYFKVYGEALNIAHHRYQVFKTHKINYLNYYLKVILNFIIILLLSSLLLIFKTNECLILFTIFLTMNLIILLSHIIRLITIYIYHHGKHFKGEIILDEEGLTNQSYYDIKITFNWSKIKAIVIGKHSITFLTDTPFYFYVSLSEKNKVIASLEEYNHKDLLLTR